MILMAVQRWPLKLRDPETHCWTARWMSASSRMMAGFLASRPRHTRRRCGLGWALCSASAALLWYLGKEEKKKKKKMMMMMMMMTMMVMMMMIMTTNGGQ